MADILPPPTFDPPDGRRGYVRVAPAEAGDPFTVVIPGFAGDLVFDVRRWMPRGEVLPAVGDEVLVLEDEQLEPWVVAWWPA